MKEEAFFFFLILMGMILCILYVNPILNSYNLCLTEEVV